MKRLIIIFIMITVAFLAYFNMPQSEHRLLKKAPVGQAIELESADGVFELNAQNRLAMIYFGYSFCPDICPTSLSKMSRVFNALDETELNKTIGLFISVDPARDNLMHLKEYSQYFHPNIMGLTGKQDIVDKLVENFGAAYKIVEGESADGYIIDHTSFIYLTSPEGRIIHAFPHNMSAEDILKIVKLEISQFDFSN